MDFLVMCIAVLITATLAKFFYKTIAGLAIIGILLFLIATPEMKAKLNSMASTENTGKILKVAIDKLMGVSETAASKTIETFEEVKKESSNK